MSWIIDFLAAVLPNGVFEVLAVLLLIVTALLGGSTGDGGETDNCYSTYQEALVACGGRDYVGDRVESTPTGGYQCFYCHNKRLPVSDSPYDVGSADAWNDYALNKDYQGAPKGTYSEAEAAEYARGYDEGWLAAATAPGIS